MTGRFPSGVVRVPMRCHLLLAGVLLASTASCADFSPSDELTAARRRWAAWGPASYDLTVSRSCECLTGTGGPFIVRVRNGTVESITYVATGEPVPWASAAVPTVPGLFEIIAGALRDDPDRFSASYDPETGYPTHISVDPREGVADDEFGWTAILHLSP